MALCACVYIAEWGVMLLEEEWRQKIHEGINKMKNVSRFCESQGIELGDEFLL